MAAPSGGGGTRGLLEPPAASGTACARGVSLSFTLPVSCHVCLNRVQEPMCCPNLHVFCAACIELWLRTSPHCPVCRCPVTAEKPCARLIGGGDVPHAPGSPTQRRRLRSARLEVLRREYEEEAETLAVEVERLQGENNALWAQLRANPGEPAGSEVDGRPAGSEVDPAVLLALSGKLKAARDELRATRNEMSREREVHAQLREENVDLQRENQSLRMEIDSRSPHRFGRATVAALQAKLEQQRRELGRLGKALERSDRYTDELEARLAGVAGATGVAGVAGVAGVVGDPREGREETAAGPPWRGAPGGGTVRRLAFDVAATAVTSPPPVESGALQGGGGGAGGPILSVGVPPPPEPCHGPPQGDREEGAGGGAPGSPLPPKRTRAED
ncbi:ORC ubiquitin ligase 1-like [Lethenteron reissneri]|uniref:ORC ubiquitin ligase 1-like n=1 Tax=Lethenteron reissneri TaxID=7753 RepID=UPI002AB68D0E|nr:ORC ubiquitin ligase 1-like [Lethenteron reissneri]